jgi:hypothetical protein
MTLALKSLADLDPNAVSQFHSQLSGLLQTYAPAADLRRGFLGDIVLHLAAILGVDIQDLQTQLEASVTVAGLQANPTLADPETVTDLFSNYRLIRRTGTQATGTVTFLLNASSSFSLDADFGCTMGNMGYTIDQACQVQTSTANVVADTDLVIRLVRAGVYAVDVPMVANATGAAYNMVAGTSAIPTVNPPGFLSGYSATAIVGGSNDETDVDLASRMEAGMAAFGSSNRAAVRAVLQQVSALADLTAVSIAAAGNAEQHRYHGVFPIAFGGRMDAWLRTAPLWTTITVPVTATLINLSGIWQVAIPRTTAPGFYDITGITITANGLSVTLSSDVRGFDLTGINPVPDVAFVVEGAYTAFQTSIIQITDTHTSTAGLIVNTSTQSYQVTFRLLSAIDQAQSALSDPGYGCPGLDSLARAAVPCFVTVSLTVTQPAGTPAVNTDQMAADIAGAVNATAFIPSLTTALVLAAAQPRLAAGQTAGSLILQGHLRRLDGTVLTINGSPDLVLPNDPTDLVTANTVCFFLQASDVTINVVA